MRKFKDAIKLAGDEKDRNQRFSLSPKETEMKTKANHLCTNSNYMRDIYKKFDVQNKHAANEVESGRALGDSLREFSSKASGTSTNHLTNCLRNVGELQRNLEDLKSDLHSKLSKVLSEPFRNCVKGEIKEALEAEKRFDRARSNYDSALMKLNGLNEKQKVNLSKVNEAEKEVSFARTSFESTSKDSFDLISQTSEKVEFETLARLVKYVETYHDYFESSLQKVESLLGDLEEYRDHVEKERTEFEKKTNRTTERILDTRRKQKKIVKSPENSSSEIITSNKSFDEDEDDEQEEDNEELKRKRIIEDLYDEEKSYVSQLGTIMTAYLEPMRRLAKDPKSRISDDQIASIFSNVEELYVLHNELLDELQDTIENYPKGSVGMIFLNKLKKFEKYILYTSNYSKSSQTLKDLKQYRSVNSLLKSSEKVDSSGLAVLLQIPLKRMNQYEFFLEKIFQMTETTDSDFENLSNAVDEITQLSENVMKSNAKAAEMGEILSVQKKLIGFEENLVEPDRCLVKQGVLGMIKTNKVSKKGNIKIVNYHWFLFNDIMMFASKSKISTRLVNPRQPVNINPMKDFLKYRGHLVTNKMRVEETPDSTTMKNAFKLFCDDEEYTVCATTLEERNSWMQVIQDTIKEAYSKKVFRVPVSHVMKNPKEAGRSIPRLATLTVNFIGEHGMETEGIFRLSGSANEIQNMKDQIDRGKEISTTGKDPHAIAGLFKLWLREMPEPLLTFDLYDQWIATADMKINEAVLAAKKLLLQLPTYNRFLVQYLMKFLVRVAKKEDTNKMGASNLSLVFGPSILCKKNSDPFDTSELRHVYSVIQMFINQYEKIFPMVEDERKEFEEQEMKGLEERKEKEFAEREKMKQDVIGEKKEKEERTRREKEARERKKQQELDQEKREKEEMERKKREKREQREKEEKEKRILEEIREENEREKERQRQIEEKQRQAEEQQRRELDEKKQREKERKSKREKDNEDHRKQREQEEARYKQMMEEKRREEDYKRKEQHTQLRTSSSLVTCAGCNQLIGEEGIEALGKKWHSKCFKCTHCSIQISGTFMHQNGLPYCPEDYAKLFSKVCAGCHKVIEGPMIRAMNQVWHPSGCFLCHKCNGPLTGGFYEKKTKPYCYECAS